MTTQSLWEVQLSHGPEGPWRGLLLSDRLQDAEHWAHIIRRELEAMPPPRVEVRVQQRIQPSPSPSPAPAPSPQP